MFSFFKIITSTVMIMGLFFTTITVADEVIEENRILRLGSHLNFTTVNIGESDSRELILYNDGDSNLTIYGLRFHERIKSVYSGDFSGVIEPGASQSITIVFTPTEEKDYNGLVYIDSDRTNANDRSRVLKGTGINVLDNTRILAFGSHLNFGDVNVGESETRELMLYNNGNTSLTIYGLQFHESIVGIYSGDFSGEIPAGASVSVTITFTPVADSVDSGLVYVMSNKTNIEADSSRSLIGHTILTDVTTRILTFGEHLDFGNVAIGESATKVLTLKNEGNSDLSISGLQFHESLESAYSGNFVGIIPPNESRMVMITFSPTEEKAYSGLVYINSDQTNSNDRSRLVKGIGVNSVAFCSGELANRILKFGTHLDFGHVSLGSTTTRDLILTNEGDCDVTIEELTFHESLEGVYTGSFSGLISAGDSQVITLTFSPVEEKDYNGLVYVVSDKTNSGDRSRLLTGSAEVTCGGGE